MLKPILSIIGCVLSTAVTAAVELSGKTEFEITAYAEEGQYSEQDYQTNGSVALVPEFYWSWNDNRDSLFIKPFARVDARDDERSHGDIRELAWIHVNDLWEFRTGIRKVFWGVTEFNHLVDIINQTDSVESFDGEEKLGQPMINISRVTDWGIVDAFILTGFRERTFAGEEGRLRSGLIVDADNATYESDDEEKHIDFAVRWSYSVSVFDLGVYWFDGTGRDPLLQPQWINGETVLVPYYQQINQSGIDIQATINSWLWKWETIYQTSDEDDFWATQAGFEYTIYGVNQSAMDVGVLLEFGHDQRKTTSTNIAQNDIYLGSRIVLNDVMDSTLLMGFSYDQDYHTRSLLVEASRRLNDRWTVSVEGLIIEANDPADVLAALEKDDRVQVVLERFF